MIEDHRYLPDTNRMSVLTAMILLAYAVTPFITIPARAIQLQLPGIFLSFSLNFTTLTSLFAAALAGVGADWLLRSHPSFERRRNSRYWLLPTLTAWVIGVPLQSLQVGPQWWAVFGLGGLLLALVFAAEYIVLEPADLRHVPAAVGLTAVALALFLTLAIAVRAAGPRLYLELPAILGAIFLVTLRSLYLRLGSGWHWEWSAGVTLVTGQVAVGLHYWPISPLQYGLILLGVVYALTSIAGSLEEGRTWESLWVEPAVMLFIFWLMAFLVRR